MSSPPARVRWTAERQGGGLADWAGDGSGTALRFDEDHVGGAAVLVRFTTNGNRPQELDAWIPPGELEPIDTEETAS